MTTFIEVKATGPLFEGTLAPKLVVGANLGASKIAAEGVGILKRVLGQRPRGPARWGHIVDAPRSQIMEMGPDQVGVRLYLGGTERFLGPILEGGAVPHYVSVRRSRRGGRRRGRGGARALAIQVGGGLIFRAAAGKDLGRAPRTPAFHWREQAQAQLEPRLGPLMEQAMEEALSL